MNTHARRALLLIALLPERSLKSARRRALAPRVPASRLSATGAAGALCAAREACPGGNSRMNVLFLAADDMRMQLGNDRVPGTHAMYTPHLDGLANRSLFLRKAQVQQAVCSPTRTSLLTSRYPDTTRVWDLVSYWRDVGGNFTTIRGSSKDMATTPSDPGKYSTLGTPRVPAATCPVTPAKATTHLTRGAHLSSTLRTKIFGAGKPASQGVVNVATHGLPSRPTLSKEDLSQARKLPILPLNPCQTSQSTVLARAAAMPTTADRFLAVGFHKPHLRLLPASGLQPLPDGEHQFAAGSRPAGWHAQITWSNWGELRGYLDNAALGNSGQPGDHLPANVTRLFVDVLCCFDVDRLQHWARPHSFGRAAKLTTQ